MFPDIPKIIWPIWPSFNWKSRWYYNYTMLNIKWRVLLYPKVTVYLTVLVFLDLLKSCRVYVIVLNNLLFHTGGGDTCGVNKWIQESPAQPFRLGLHDVRNYNVNFRFAWYKNRWSCSIGSHITSTAQTKKCSVPKVVETVKFR